MSHFHIATLTHIGRDVPDNVAFPLMWERMMRRIKVCENGCWEWLGNKNTKGYGQLLFRNERWMAHRLAYRIKVGPIPPKMQACHKCDNRTCVNPDHIFIGTNQDNCIDMVAKRRHQNNRKTHCPKGHEYTAENTKTHVDCYGWKHRRCLTCERNRIWVKPFNYAEKQRAWRARRKARLQLPQEPSRG